MNVTVAALVGHDTRERVEVRLPGLSSRAWRGPSTAELLDDAALHLMEAVPKWPAERLHTLSLNPDVRLRKVTVERALAFGGGRRRTDVKARLTCVATRWSADGFWVVHVPRLGLGPFGVPNLSDLEAGLGLALDRWATTGTEAALGAAQSLRDERIELVDVDVELPSVLPSHTPRRRKRPRPKPEKAKPERVWVPARELREVGVDLVHRALDGRLHPALGRDALVDDLVGQLREDGAAILLVGERGVGKTAIVEAVAMRFAAEGKSLQERTDVWRVDAARLIAGMSYVGSWERRLGRVVDELVSRQDVLVVDDLPGLAWAGRSAQSDTTMAGYLLPHLQRGELRVLAECTPERLEAGRLRNPGFFSCFRIVRVDALDRGATARVLLQHLRLAEAERGLAGGPALIEGAMGLARRFGARLAEPGRSVTLFRRFLAEARPTRQDALGNGLVTPAMLTEHFGVQTGLPDFVLQPGAGRPPDALRDELQHLVVGQPHALDAMVDVVATLQEGLDDPDRPVATLLFVGPTGVGKTESAKALATLLFGDPGRLLRFDMSETHGPDGLRRLVGGPGRPDGDLTRAVANQPFAVVLLDEIEKAGPAVFDLLLQVLGEGRLTNAVGQTTDFRNTVVVMTSNLGVDTARRRTGFGTADPTADDAHFRSAAQAFFRPELFNRIDRIVPFRALGREDVRPLVARIVGRVLGRRGLRRSGVVVEIDDVLRDHLAHEGFDPLYGARALQRVVEREITVPLARVLVDRPPGRQGALVELWRGPDGLGIAVDPLEDAPVEVPARGMPEDWEGVGRLFRETSDRLEALGHDPRWEALGDVRSALLASVQDAPASGDWDRLEQITALVDERGALESALQDFAQDWLGAFRFDDGWSIDRAEHKWFGVRKRLVTQAVPRRVDRGRTLGTAASGALDLALRVAAVAHRVRHLDRPASFALRVEPLHTDGRSLAREVATALVGAWSGWGPLGVWSRGTDGWVPELLDDAGDLAVCGSIPGLSELVRPDVGLWLDARDHGADRVLRLVRFSVLDGVTDVAGALQAHVEARAARASSRRAGAVTTALPGVVHRFGVLHPGTPGAPRLASLADDLRRLALLRT